MASSLSYNLSMKTTLTLNVSQNLVITPQLQQAIHLLQLSSLELQQEIQQALEENPLLELEDEQDGLTEDELNTDINTQAASADNEASAETSAASDTEDFPEENWQENNLPDQLAVDASWDDIYSHDYNPAPTSSTSSSEGYELATSSTSLNEHLLWQLNLSLHNEQDLLVGEAIIDSLSPSGYLEEDLTALMQGLKKHHSSLSKLSLEEVEVVLKLIQGFDPLGVAARSLKECLLIQLNQLADDTPNLDNAKFLVENFLEILGNRDFNFLKRRLKLKTDAELAEVVELIQTLNPRPGEALNNTTTDYIVPDLLLKATKQGWLVELNPEAQPRLRVNASYSRLIQQADTVATKDYLRGHQRDANWLIKSLQNRSETLLKVGTTIVEKQQKFFTHGEEYMQPLILADIADAIDMHESTISRATTQKYIHTPKGIFELKYFFSSNLSTTSGKDTSSTAIKAQIRKFISEEPVQKPLSDNQLTQLLEKQGIKIARRTVAKYRESLNIPPSNERKRLA